MSEATMSQGEERGVDTVAMMARMRGEMLAMREAETEPVWLCPECRDTGMVVDGDWTTIQVARPCGCGVARAARRRLARAGIPQRYREATLDTLRTAGMDPSVGMAARTAREIVTTYPCGDGRGLLLTGNCGVGKTHLAIGLLRELVTTRGASGRWWDLYDLLVQLKRSYGSPATGEAVARSEGSLLDEIAAVDVLVLDELGAQRLTDWSMEEVSVILGARYNANRLTVLTTNYPNLPPGAGQRGLETLGDRVGARIWSRLAEMCRCVEVTGADYRQKGKRGEI